MKIPVAILGATGCVGQKFVQLLAEHPWFEIVALCASERSIGKTYAEAVHWLIPTPLPAKIAQMRVEACQPTKHSTLAFSGLDASVAGDIETAYAEAGYTVVSNARNHRLDPRVPLIVPEVNPEHLELLHTQPFKKGKIVTNPNCAVIGLVLALKPLQEKFGIESLLITTMQAVSGAGYPGVASLDITDNVIPHIRGEEDKIESEPLKILGKLNGTTIQQAAIKISAHCNRVPVTDGHTACVSIKLSRPATNAEIITAWNNFTAEPQRSQLPTAPLHPTHYFAHDLYPQPKLHRHLDKGMAVSIGRLRPCPLFDYKFALLSHNTVRGAAGAALLNAELMVSRGLIK